MTNIDIPFKQESIWEDEIIELPKRSISSWKKNVDRSPTYVECSPYNIVLILQVKKNVLTILGSLHF